MHYDIVISSDNAWRQEGGHLINSLGLEYNKLKLNIWMANHHFGCCGAFTYIKYQRDDTYQSCFQFDAEVITLTVSETGW